MDRNDKEANRLSARARRYARVGTNVGGVAARVAATRLFGVDLDKDKNAVDLAQALGGLKGPIMKVAQLLSTIPEALPAEYAAELATLQSQAPPMGPAFTRRRMKAELGEDWEKRFATFEIDAAASASLGQVHRAKSHKGKDLACKLQYPDMQSAVEADLNQLNLVFSIHKRMNPGIDTTEIAKEIGARLREELDYDLEARHTALYRIIFKDDPHIRVPKILDKLSTGRLLTMNWLDGRPVYPFSHYGVIHGDPHLGNYTIFEDEAGAPAGLNLLDYGCMRTFTPKFVQGVIDLYQGLRTDDRDLMVHAYRTWGFKDLSRDVTDILDIWARFIYGPMLDDRVRVIAEDVSPGEYGRREAFKVHQALREKGPVEVPREFVFMDRAAIGLGGVFLHLNARLNYCRLFTDTIQDFDLNAVAERQKAVFGSAGVPLPTAG
jgi:predicted unusual protein kinase regulating ubiquinone biosynthesis (AarF/ABC1/UbiB family)